jgi:hypothetical protein
MLMSAARPKRKLWLNRKELSMSGQSPQATAEYLQPTVYCDSDNYEIRKTALTLVKDAHTPRDAAVRIFLFVRDEILFAMDEPTEASQTLRRKTGQCVSKSTLQIALFRAAGIPARYNKVDVHKNCLKGLISPEVFNQFADSIDDHPWCECYLSERWISCEALYDRALYEAAVEQGILDRNKITTIDWDGERNLATLSAWILKDKGTAPHLDDLIETHRRDFGQFWHLCREFNQYTVKVRTNSPTVSRA